MLSFMHFSLPIDTIKTQLPTLLLYRQFKTQPRPLCLYHQTIQDTTSHIMLVPPDNSRHNLTHYACTNQTIQDTMSLITLVPTYNSRHKFTHYSCINRHYQYTAYPVTDGHHQDTTACHVLTDTIKTHHPLVILYCMNNTLTPCSIPTYIIRPQSPC